MQSFPTSHGLSCRKRLPLLGSVATSLVLLVFVAPAGAQVQFEDVTDGSGVEYTGESYGASWGYANDDPLPDLFVSHHRNKPGLFINLGNGKFEDRAFEIDAWQITPRSDTHGGTFADAFEPRQAAVVAGPVRTGDDEPHMIGKGILQSRERRPQPCVGLPAGHDRQHQAGSPCQQVVEIEMALALLGATVAEGEQPAEPAIGGAGGRPGEDIGRIGRRLA